MAPPSSHGRRFTPISGKAYRSRRGGHSSARATRPSKTDSQRNQAPSRRQYKSAARRSYSQSITPRDEISPNVSVNRTFEPEGDAEIRGREESDDLSQILMAIDITGLGTVGCCYYVASEEKLYLLQDVKAGGETVINMLKADIEPTLLLISSRVKQDDDRVDDQGMTEDSEINRFRLPYDVELRPNQEFNYENGKRKLLSLQLRSHDQQSIDFLTPGVTAGDDGYETTHDHLGFNAQQGRLLHLSSIIDVDNRLTLGCAGAVLSHLQRLRTSAYLPGDPAANALYRVKSMEMFVLKETMLVNTDTLRSLQILHSESHPNIFNQGPGQAPSGSKESLSVYGLFHHLAHTPQGKQRLRQIFLRPSLNLDLINERLHFISVFVRPENMDPVSKIVYSLKRIKNLHPVMVHLHKGISGSNNKLGGFRSGVWATLLAFAFHALDLRISIQEISGAETVPLLTKVAKTLDSVHIYTIGQLLHNEIDMESSIEQHRTVFKRGIDDDLDRMKQTYDGMDDLLSKAAQKIASEIAGEYDELDLNVIYFPQIGFLVTMPSSSARDLIQEGSAVEAKWERMFTSDERVYYKERRTMEMDEVFGDIYAIICEREIELVHELAQRILQYEDMLVEASDVLGELDALLALAQGAQMHKFDRPRVTRDNVIEIQAGRHPLQELTVPSYVANDTLLVGGTGNDARQEMEEDSKSRDDEEVFDGPSMLVLTGPNYSGKSVYQKQVALIVYLAHIGSYVPAGKAIIGVTDKILTRINTQETVSKIQSAFLLDLQQIALSLTQATHRSLVILDEFGKGTDSSDGAGLACGVLEYLLSLGNHRPKVLAATHFHEIFENDFLSARPELSFGHMEVRIDARAEETEHQITYLYNFCEGKNHASFGTNCAAMNGIDRVIVDRANQLSDLDRKGEDLLAACCGVSEEEEEGLQDAEAIARSFLENDFSNALIESSDGTTEDPRTSLEEILSAASVAGSSSRCWMVAS